MFQQIFDQVARALIAQGRPSVTPDEFEITTCLYRTPDGAKCAAGHLIPDDEYDPEMESIQASWIAGRPPEDAVGESYTGPISPTLRKIVDATSVEFVNRLQQAHDAAAEDAEDAGIPFPDGFRRRMTKLAEEFGLNTDALA